MLGHLAVGLVSLALLVTSGATGETDYLCRMGGQVHSDCCCGQTAGERGDSCEQLERAGGCCELHVRSVAPQPLANERSKRQVQPLPAAGLPTASPRVAPPGPSGAPRGEPTGAAPPGTGPPLFVWNCSYLI